MNKTTNKTQRQIFERRRFDAFENNRMVYMELMDILRVRHKEFAGSNYDKDFRSELDWSEFINNIDHVYQRRVRRLGIKNYKQTKYYRKWTNNLNLLRNSVKYRSNRRYRIFLSELMR